MSLRLRPPVLWADVFGGIHDRGNGLGHGVFLGRVPKDSCKVSHHQTYWGFVSHADARLIHCHRVSSEACDRVPFEAQV